MKHPGSIRLCRMFVCAVFLHAAAVQALPTIRVKPQLAGERQDVSEMKKVRREGPDDALECFAVSSNVHVLRWTAGGDDLAGCQAHAASLTTALAQCPSNSDSKGVTCLVAGGDAIVSPTDINTCDVAAAAVMRGVRLYANDKSVVQLSCMLGVLRYRSAGECAAALPHINAMAVDGFPDCERKWGEKNNIMQSRSQTFDPWLCYRRLP